MRYAPALPIYQLMPAVGSLMVPVATSLVAGLPENFPNAGALRGV